MVRAFEVSAFEPSVCCFVLCVGKLPPQCLLIAVLFLQQAVVMQLKFCACSALVAVLFVLQAIWCPPVVCYIMLQYDRHVCTEASGCSCCSPYCLSWPVVVHCGVDILCDVYMEPVLHFIKNTVACIMTISSVCFNFVSIHVLTKLR